MITRNSVIYTTIIYDACMCADASQEAVLCRLLQNVALKTAQSVSTYAQTSDTRHLLLPARQLIKVPNTDGDKLVSLLLIITVMNISVCKCARIFAYTAQLDWLFYIFW